MTDRPQAGFSEPLHVVVVHHDAPERCIATVAALQAQNVDVRVTVVDNGSAPAAVAALRAGCASTEIIHSGGNLGYGPGANVGLRAWLADGQGEWVAVAAHDALPAPGCLAALLTEGHARPDAAFVAAEFGTDYDIVPVVNTVLGGYCHPAVRGAGWVDVDYPHGTLFLARRRALEEIGLFDERYFAYCEEVDLGLRARALGWRIGMVWGAVVINGRLPSQMLADYLQGRNTLLLVRTRFGRREAVVRSVLSVSPAVRRAVIDRRRWDIHLRLGGLALLDFWRGRFGPPSPAVLQLVQLSGRPATTATRRRRRRRRKPAVHNEAGRASMQR